MIAAKIKGIGVFFGIVIDENNVVDTIIEFSEQDKNNLETWNKYLK